MAKKNDALLLAGIVLSAIAILAVTHLAGKARGSGGEIYAAVTVDGGLYGEFPLYENTVVDIVSPLGHNTLVIADGQAYISEADCPDKYCAQHRAVSECGDAIICLPHKLVVEIKAYGGNGADTGIDAVV